MGAGYLSGSTVLVLLQEEWAVYLKQAFGIRRVIFDGHVIVSVSTSAPTVARVTCMIAPYGTIESMNVGKTPSFIALIVHIRPTGKEA